MVKKKIIKVVSYGLGAILLLIPMVSLVTATSERQIGNRAPVQLKVQDQARPVPLVRKLI
jgi:hypothetical protein